jgi:protocatechuate 3,4-dioxygenase beta subunit
MPPPDSLPNRFRPYDDAGQPAVLIPGYKETLTRNPARPLIVRPATLSEITGPTQLARKLPTGMRDLSRKSAQGPRAMGQLILVRGCLRDEDGLPVRGSVIELWHANAAGRYLHPMDAQSPAPLDDNFLGSGRVLTDDQGRYEFVTVKPGAYPVPNHPQRWWRPPHIHISVFGDGFMSRLVTQMFFPGDPLNETDLILNAVPDARGRERMVARQIAMMDMPVLDAVGFEHDIVVRGERQTPFEKPAQ